MKLRIRVSRQTSRLELLGEDPSLKDLIDQIRGSILSTHGLSADSEFSLSLNGTELLTDNGQTLSSCGIVSGDLISVILPESTATTAAASSTSSSSSSSSSSSLSSFSTQQASSSSNIGSQKQEQTRQMTAMTSSQTSLCSPAVPSGSEGNVDVLDPEPSVPIWEPMLCSEAENGQAPLSLELLYHVDNITSPSDAIMVAGNLLMLETGFIHEGSALKSTEMPAGWRRAGGVYKLQYTHPLCENSLAMVVAVCMGPILTINATLNVNQTVNSICKLCLNPSSYVTDEWPGESAAAAFKDLNKLSRIFKDQVAYPLIAAAREAMALPVAFGLGALPPELLLRVLRLLDVHSIVRLSSVNRHFHVSTADSTLWRHLFCRDFKGQDSSKRSRDTDWKELYKTSYKIRIKNRCVPHHPYPLPFVPNPRDIFNPLPVPFPPPIPGIIGGEYDQRPNIPQGLLPRPRYDPLNPFRGQGTRWF
ncbi:F-box only protein 7 isoform X3 [Sphaeramia orbicularis]|uniref:F-box only protein 7 isoform X3 n=1 Tax=Sphaeramia orbicularis TaxID=375764 RepID=UPI00117EBD87|nr:F-box only protein 7 isoform X3 [Sphaeramia orbicularis]